MESDLTEFPKKIRRERRALMQPVTTGRLRVIVLLVIVCLAVPMVNIVRAGVDYTGISYRTTTVFSEGDQNRWWMGEAYTQASYSTENLGLKMRFDFSHSRPEGDLRWGYDKNAPSLSDVGDSQNGQLSGRIFFQEQYIQSLVSVSALSDKISTSLGWRYLSSDRQEYSAKIWLQPMQNLGVGIKRSNTYPLPSYSELFYTYRSNGELNREGGRLNWFAPAWVTEFTVNLSLLESINIESTIREFDFRPRTPGIGESSPGTYLGVIDGFWYDSRISAGYQTKSDWSVALTYRQIGIHNRLRMYYGGQQFANFGIVEADSRIWSFGFEYKNWLLDFQSGFGEGELKGVVKAWPFVDGLLQFLGERRHFIGVAEVDWRMATLGGPIFDSRRLSLVASLDYLHIVPDLRYATWRPKMFGMGYDDLKGGRLNIIRADLIRLAIKPAFRFSRFIIEFDVSQWLPLSVKKSESKSEAPTPSPEPPPENPKTSEEKRNLWGGFNATVNIRVEF